MGLPALRHRYATDAYDGADRNARDYALRLVHPPNRALTDANDRLSRQHLADLAEIRAAHAQEIDAERQRNGALTAAVVDALKAVGKPVAEGGVQ
jgi:hypothetical protein